MATATASAATPWRQRLAVLRDQPLIFHFATALLALHLLLALIGPLVAPYEPAQLQAGPTFESPSWSYPFGTDNFGRDVFSRVIHGERVVLALALASTGVAVVVGTAIAILSAFAGGWVDQAVNRTVDVLMTIPPLLIALLILSAVGSGFTIMVATVAFIFVLRVVTVVRAAALAVVTEDYVTAARLRGETARSVAYREILPNVASTVLVEFSLRTGMAVLFIGGLSFLGFGAAPPTPEWGLMINEGRQFITTSPWIVLAPAVTLASLVVALSLFTEGMSEIFGLARARSGEA